MASDCACENPMLPASNGAALRIMAGTVQRLKNLGGGGGPASVVHAAAGRAAALLIRGAQDKLLLLVVHGHRVCFLGARSVTRGRSSRGAIAAHHGVWQVVHAPNEASQIIVGPKDGLRRTSANARRQERSNEWR